MNSLKRRYYDWLFCVASRYSRKTQSFVDAYISDAINENRDLPNPWADDPATLTAPMGGMAPIGATIGQVPQPMNQYHLINFYSGFEEASAGQIFESSASKKLESIRLYQLGTALETYWLRVREATSRSVQAQSPLYALDKYPLHLHGGVLAGNYGFEETKSMLVFSLEKQDETAIEDVDTLNSVRFIIGCNYAEKIK